MKAGTKDDRRTDTHDNIITVTPQVAGW